jgi:hypothetical protein
MAGQAYVTGGVAPARAARGERTGALVKLIARLRGAGERPLARPLRSTGVEMPSFTLYMDKVRPHDMRPFW